MHWNRKYDYVKQLCVSGVSGLFFLFLVQRVFRSAELWLILSTELMLNDHNEMQAPVMYPYIWYSPYWMNHSRARVQGDATDALALGLWMVEYMTL